MLGGYGMSAITAVTAQNTLGVHAVEALDADFVMAQVDACLDDIGADGIKIGMLGSPATAQALARRLDSFAGPIVFDPVMVATSGAALADEATIAGFAELMAIATIVTPNIPELAALTGRTEPAEDAIVDAGLDLASRHDVMVLAKGGHAETGDQVLDRVLAPSGKIASFGHARLETRHTHGRHGPLGHQAVRRLAEAPSD